MPTLANFQTDTAHALSDPNRRSPELVSERDTDGSSRRFNIYRNNRAASLIDALQSTYPVLCKLTGEAFFTAAARQFIDDTPPLGPVMSEYGNGFGEFIQQLPGASNYPYLADVATLEWERLQAFHAADQHLLTLNDLQSIDPEQLTSKSFIAHDAVRLVKSAWAIGSLWNSVSNGGDSDFTLAQAENVLITRPMLEVNLHLLDQAGATFLEQLHHGESIVQAATEALTCDESFNTGAQLQALLSMGAFSAISDQ